MILLYLLFAGLNQINSSFAQTVTTKRQVQTILSPQSIYLNGTANGAAGGKSRTYYKIDLPSHTVEWYYIFSTSASEERNKTLDLTSQLTNLIDPTGLTSIAAKSLFAPSGEAVIDVYVMGSQNKGYFLEKDSWGAWVYDNPGGYDEGKNVNAKQGKARIDDVTTGTVYIGLKNPSTWSGVNITIEVAAIVEVEEVNMTEWSADSKENIFETYRNSLIDSEVDEAVASEIANCFILKLTQKYSPVDFNNLTDSEINDISTILTQECTTEMQGGEKTEEQKKGATIGGMGWSAYENGDIEKAINYSKKALEYDSTLGWVHGNLGLFYLIKNDELTALEFYLDAITQIKKDKINAKEYFSEIIKDIENAKQKYPELQGYKEILEQLKREQEGL